MSQIKNVIIFAAGKGTRMNPITEHTPKPLIRIHGESMIERNIKYLINSNIKDITIVVGYLKDQFQWLVEKYDVKLITNEDYDIANNISSLFYSKDLWGDTLYIEGDIYLKENIIPQLVQVIKKTNDSIMFGAIAQSKIKEWYFNVNAAGFVINHELGNAHHKAIWTGIFFMNKVLAKEMNNFVGNWYQKNQQSYAETMFWELKNKFLLQNIAQEVFIELDHFADLIKIDPAYAHHENKVLFTPGPTNVPRELWDIVAQGIVHHRSKLMSFYIKRLTEQLKWIFQAPNGTPLILTASGTGAMEASVVNFVNEGDQVVVINGGDFSQRYVDLLTTYKAKIINHQCPKNGTFDLALLKEQIKGAKAVYVIHHETSNGVLHDIETISNLTKHTDTLLIVDSISSIITEDLKFDQWNIDVALASSPKAFSLPPGISFVCLSKKAIKKLYDTKTKSFYFDLKKYIKYYHDFAQTPFTPSISLIVAAISAIEIIENKTLSLLRKEKKQIYHFLRKEFIALGFKAITDPKISTIAMLCLKVPKGVSAINLREKVSNNNNIYFEIGRHNEADQILRIGLIGPVTMTHAKALLAAVKENMQLSLIVNNRNSFE